MNNKNIFSLIGIFAVLLLSLSLASAVLVFTPTTVTGTEDAGETLNLDFIAHNDYTADLTAITSTFSDLTSGTDTLPASALSLTSLPATIASNTDSPTITLNVVIPSAQAIGTYIGNVNIAGTYTDGVSYDLPVEITVTATEEPQDITDCKADGNIGSLSVKIEDINVRNGFGYDDEYWYPFDEIELEVEVEVDGSWDIEDIEVNWGIWNTDEQDFVIDDNENDFNLDYDDDEEVLKITFNLNSKIKKYSKGDNILYVWATAKIDDSDAGADDGKDVCVYDEDQSLDIITDDDFVLIDDIEMPDTTQCGTSVPVSFNVENTGDDQQDEVLVIIVNNELGINKRIEVGDLDDFDRAEYSILLDIPTDAEEKLQYIEFAVYDDDQDIYKTDEGEDKSKTLIPINILGNCEVESTEPTITASLLSDAVIGEELVIQVSVVNNGDASENFVIAVENTDNWAEVVDVSPQILTIAQDSTKQATITLKPTQAGTQTFDITLIYSGNEVTQQVNVAIEEKTGFMTGAFSGLELGETGLYIIAGVFLVLIIVILALIVKVAKAPKEAEF